MRIRSFLSAWSAAVAAALVVIGATVGAMSVLQNDDSSPRGDEASIRGVASGASGAAGEEDEPPEGVETLPPIEQDPEATTVKIEGVRGADGATVDVENTIEGVGEAAGSIQAIRGIEGIDTVMLENLEMVLRMQQRPEENDGKGGVSAAASLLATEPSEEFEERPDDREVMLEFELEGS